MTVANDAPGVEPAQLFHQLDDVQAERILPSGAFGLVTLVDPECLKGSRRAETLGRLISLDLAVDDPERRSLLLDAVPSRKLRELEDRIQLSVDSLRTKTELEPSLRRQVLWFFGQTVVGNQRKVPLESVTSIVPRRGLFPHQKKAASAVERFLYLEEGRVMLHLPTGVGKTRTAMSVVASHLRSRSKGLVVWLAATRELLEQAAGEFEATWQAVGDRQMNCVRYWSDHDAAIEEVSDGIVFAGLAKLHSYGKRRERLWRLGDRTTMVVFDEAHQAVATTYLDVVETVATRNPRTPVLGLSATPGRTWGTPDIDAAVARLFRENKVTIDFGEENPIRRLTDDGYLARVEFVLLNVEPGLQLTAEDLGELYKALEVPEDLAKRLGEDQQRNLRIVQRLLELIGRHRRVLVFAPSVDAASLLTSICRGVGLAADAVTGLTNAEERRVVIDRFKRPGGPPRILINFGVLTTGFDAPAASAALIARPTRSLVLYSQMVGRVIRGPRAGGTERCEVVTVVDTTLPGFGSVAEAFMNWEDVWNTS